MSHLEQKTCFARDLPKSLIVVHFSTSLTEYLERWWREHDVLYDMFSNFSMLICTIVYDPPLGAVSAITWLQVRSPVPRTVGKDHEKEKKPLTLRMEGFTVSTWYQMPEQLLWLLWFLWHFMGVQIRSGSLISHQLQASLSTKWIVHYHHVLTQDREINTYLSRQELLLKWRSDTNA
jgi:hypothetical protein